MHASLFDNKKNLLKLCDLIEQMKIDEINNDIAGVLCDELSLPKYKKVKNVYIYRKKLICI